MIASAAVSYSHKGNVHLVLIYPNVLHGDTAKAGSKLHVLIKLTEATTLQMKIYLRLHRRPRVYSLEGNQPRRPDRDILGTCDDIGCTVLTCERHISLFPRRTLILCAVDPDVPDIKKRPSLMRTCRLV